MRVHSRIQINLLMDSTRFNSRLKPFENVVIPIVWMEIAVEKLTPGLILLLHMLFNVLPYVQAGCVFLLCIVGVALYAVAALTFFYTPAVEIHDDDYICSCIHSETTGCRNSCCNSPTKNNAKYILNPSKSSTKLLIIFFLNILGIRLFIGFHTYEENWKSILMMIQSMNMHRLGIYREKKYI